MGTPDEFLRQRWQKGVGPQGFWGTQRTSSEVDGVVQSPSILAPEPRALGSLLPCWAHKCLSADPQARTDVSRWIMSPSPLRVRTDASYLAPTTVKPPHSQVGTAHFVTLVFADSQARIDVMAHRQQ